MVKEHLEIENSLEHYSIPAVLTYEEKDVPLVVLIHGTASSKDEVGMGYDILAEKLAKKNIASIRFDFPGCGEHKADYVRYDIEAALSDIDCVINEAKQKLNVKSVSVLGWSQGGTLALLAGAQRKDIVSVVTWAGALHLAEMIAEDQVEQMYNDGYVTQYFDFREPANFSLKWYREVKDLDVLSYAGKITCPLLAIAGDMDDVVDPREASMIAHAAKQGECQMIAGADHIYNILVESKTFDQMTDITINWLENKIK